jgi:flagellar motor protein MotB
MSKSIRFIKTLKGNAVILSAFLLFLPVLSWGQQNDDDVYFREIVLESVNSQTKRGSVRQEKGNENIEILYIDVEDEQPQNNRQKAAYTAPIPKKEAVSQTVNSDEIEFNKPRISNRMLVAMFNQNSDSISTEIKNRIRRMASEIRNHSYKRLIIEGFTDLGEEFAEELSMSRAKVIYDEFMRNGLDPQRTEYIGFGSKMPSESNKTQNGRQANRRVMIIVE